MESAGDPERNAPPLVVWVDGLEAKADYEVFGYFWAPGFGEGQAKGPHHWPARFGLGLASLTTYGGVHSERIPWIISPGAKISGVHGISATLEEKDPLKLGEINLSTANGGTRLIRARVGVARTDDEGRLPVFLDDFPDSIHCGKTCIDGVAVRKAAEDSVPSAGAGGSQALHFALRVQDRLSVERELAAGADVNALDADLLSPLFHPAADGDQGMVKLLLEAGADPNVAGQSVLVLTAAASTGDTAMMKLLLEAGAEVPEGRLKPASWMPENLDQSHLHPAIAAIRIGSLATLKLLLEKRPDLDFEALGPAYDESKPRNNKATSLFVVQDAIAMGHDELAAFLIDRGCELRSNKFGGPHSSVASPHFSLLARAITEGDALKRTRAALLRRGVPAVRPPLPDTDYYGDGRYFYGVVPWDGLSAAIRMGDVGLTQELLPQAGQVNGRYQDLLLALARWTGEPEILAMLREKFPNAGSRQFANREPDKEAAGGEELRMLLPRTRPPAGQPDAVAGRWTLAVIAAPAAAAQGTLIEVAAAGEEDWTVVDRELVASALTEARMANPWGGGEHRFAELGDRMAADLLIMVSLLEGKETKLLRFEAVDVATGLAVFREHMDLEVFDPDKSVNPLLGRIRAPFERARTGDRPKAITLLPFSVAGDLPHSRSLEGLFRAAIQAEVDSTPGLLSVGMQEIQAISNEQALGGEGELWAAAFTLEGGVASLDDDRIAATLRLRSMTGDGERSVDVTEEGGVDELPVLVSRAWVGLTASELFGKAEPPRKKPDVQQARAEAARLLREGEWLLNSNLASEALPLLERARLLGAEPKSLVFFHLKALRADLGLREVFLRSDMPRLALTEHPLSLPYQGRLLDSMAAARVLLDQASYYHARYGEAFLKWDDPVFWEVVEDLSFVRASIPRSLPPGVSIDEIREFGSELDRFTATYFENRLKMKKPTIAPSRFSHTLPGSIPAPMLRRNPELLKGLVQMLFACSDVEDGGSSEHQDLLRQIGCIDGSGVWYGASELVADAVRKRFDDKAGPTHSLREAALAFVHSRGDAHADAARRLAEEKAKLGRGERQRRPTWIGVRWPERFGNPGLLDRGEFSLPLHGESMLASVLHEPMGHREVFLRQWYATAIRTLVELEEKSAGDADRYMKLNSPGDRYDGLADKAASKPDAGKRIAELSEATLLWERIHGRPLHDGMIKRWKRLHPSGGNEGLRARLLVDLRQVDGSLPGLFQTPMVDQKDREQLWVYYHSFESEAVERKLSSRTMFRANRRAPRVLGVDCGSGTIATRVELARAPGFEGLKLAKNSQWGMDEESGFLVQTDNRILTNAAWLRDLGGQPNSLVTAVLLDKSDGRMIPMDPPTRVGKAEDPTMMMGKSVGAVALGDEFFFLQPAGDADAPHPTRNRNAWQLMRVGPTGESQPVTVFGRRPELTPFDSVDRAPRAILKDGNRVLVIHDWDHVGRFNPRDNSWEMDTRGPRPAKQSGRNLAKAEFRSWILPHHEVGGRGPKIVIDAQKPRPGELTYRKPGGREARLKVELDLPEDARRQPVFDGELAMEKSDTGGMRSGGRFKTLDQLRGEGRLYLVVLNQTKDDLILGLQTSGRFEWYPGRRDGLFLPLIWALPKDEFRAAAMAPVEDSKK
ncbi:ankyrin repeat domain-containing protein [Haloferula sp. A504]|uniref:ankyrin repeat domain-containing protein n=1 Tax=Haloferula sp. A504 TaxID=3373601 RepID=UPI0031C47285|nr:ankyrin repeat domain-containing protein [Verrucomicrobiaceae bacterium E54]